jgi:hypothetical protein
VPLLAEQSAMLGALRLAARAHLVDGRDDVASTAGAELSESGPLPACTSVVRRTRSARAHRVTQTRPMQIRSAFATGWSNGRVATRRCANEQYIDHKCYMRHCTGDDRRTETQSIGSEVT